MHEDATVFPYIRPTPRKYLMRIDILYTCIRRTGDRGTEGERERRVQRCNSASPSFGDATRRSIPSRDQQSDSRAPCKLSKEHDFSKYSDVIDAYRTEMQEHKIVGLQDLTSVLLCSCFCRMPQMITDDCPRPQSCFVHGIVSEYRR